jgi:kumamolisin
MDYQPVNLISADVVQPELGLMPEGLGLYLPTYLVPPAIATTYNLPSSTGYGVNIGIFSFGGGFLQSDLNKSFADMQAIGLIPSSYTPPTIRQVLLDTQTGVFSTASGVVGACSENTVDIYCLALIAPKANITIYIGDAISSMVPRAIADGMHIISMSWGSSESSSFTEESYYQQLSDAGITFLAASGDAGSALGGFFTFPEVLYPASSPNAIGVGGTKLTYNSSFVRTAETDDNRDINFGTTWGGGGGTSTTFSLPGWQTGLSYIPIVNGVTGSTTPLTSRGVPDFSAPMNVYVYYFNGAISGAGGTSLACPVLAGMMARFLQLTGIKRSSPQWNSIAYANPGAFFDITVGTNNDTTSTGYAGTVGWDPVTGLGPPVGNLLYKSIHTGLTFPKSNYGFRPKTGVGYPRQSTGAR